MLLSGGMWGTIDLTYDENEIHNKKTLPFKITEFTPFQVSFIDLDDYLAKRIGASCKLHGLFVPPGNRY